VSDPYREIPPESIEDQARKANATELCSELRRVFAHLYANQEREGPRLNYIVCAEGLGIGDDFNPDQPPPWMNQVLDEMRKETR